MKVIKRNIIFIMFCFIISFMINTNVQAAGIGMNINKNSAYVGDSFTVTVSGINGKVNITGNSNVSLSVTGTQWIRGSLTITGTAKSAGTGTVTVTPIDVSTTGANPVEVTSPASKSITITTKPVETTTQTKPQAQPTTTKKPTTTTTKKPTTTKTEVVPTKEKEEATPLWGISAVKLIGIKDNEEKFDIELDKKFDINTYEYSCNVENDVKKIEVQKDAYEYNDFVTITGIEEELKEGENIITLKLSKEGQKELLYTFKVNKEEKLEETVDISAEVNSEEKLPAMIYIPVWSFVLLEISLIVVTSFITILIMKLLKKINNKDEV